MAVAFELSDEYYLRQTLRLARKGLGRTYPNPMVGAIIVKQDKILSSGYHHQAGKAHAEVDALNKLKASAVGATLYVNLEPCAHHGKTPPCTEAIIKAGVSRVVCCSLDPNPLVSGRGLEVLRQAGIIVKSGALKSKAEQLNEAYFCFQIRQRPFIAIKFASSLDGKIATKVGDSKWITGEKARAFARRLRGQYQAILVGANTVVQDDPNLGLRPPGRSDPLRIILDSTLRVPLKSQVFRDSNVLVATTTRASKIRLEAYKNRGIDLFICPDKQILLPALLSELHRRNIVSVFIEGGGKVLGSFVDSRLVDKVYAFYGPVIIGGQESLSAVGGHGAKKISEALHLSRLSCRQLDDTFLVSSYRTPKT
jgi:diaminohydroxyphosphoribosylaminopyrimidine deaminase / 5-amino-6-(5-phosphoribosylamino)uracil reductase